VSPQRSGACCLAVANPSAVGRWGASGEARALTLPGDELVADPADTVTKAVTVEASTEVVWRWLVQIGQDRGGFYG
jgi:hypothetical protein